MSLRQICIFPGRSQNLIFRQPLARRSKSDNCHRLNENKLLATLMYHVGSRSIVSFTRRAAERYRRRYRSASARWPWRGSSRHPPFALEAGMRSHGPGASCMRKVAGRFQAGFRRSWTDWASMVSAGWRPSGTLADGSSERQADENRWRPRRRAAVVTGSRVDVPRSLPFSDHPFDTERLKTCAMQAATRRICADPRRPRYN